MNLLALSKKSVALLLLAVTLCTAAGCGSDTPHTSGAAMPNAKYQPGQVWTYHTREGEGASRLTILKVESEPKTGTIVHVAADGVSIANAKAPAGSSSKIEHMPFAEAAIDASVIEHVDTTRVPDFQEGYDAWRTAFEGGRGGVFRLPVAEAVEHMEQAMRQAGR